MVDDSAAILHMVELLEADPSLGVEGAAKIAARGMTGKESSHVERLRKKYRKLARAGQLPRGGHAGRRERRDNAIRQFYGTRQTAIDDAKRQIPGVEREAEDLGIDISRLDLFELTTELEKHRESLETPARGNPIFASSWFLGRGIVDPEEAIARSRQAEEELARTEKQIEVVRKLRMLRDIAGHLS